MITTRTYSCPLAISYLNRYLGIPLSHLEAGKSSTYLHSSTQPVQQAVCRTKYQEKPNMAVSAEPLSSLIQTWLQWDQDPQTRTEIENLRDSNNVEELEKRLLKRIQFGTAGLRGQMAAGFSCMNALTVIQASQGLAKYIEQKHPALSPRGVVIGHDARHNSAKFASLAANAFVALGIPVWWYNNSGATPLVPYGVISLGAAAGIMITASHNPAQDNGYKVYFHNGAQINSPMDVEIARSIEENLIPWPAAWNELNPHENGIKYDTYQDVLQKYINLISQYAISTVPEWKPPQPFVYTPLHGVGGLIMPSVCNAIGIKDMLSVAKQVDPDPNFPTVEFPNPEETGALDLAMKTADEQNRDLIIANDPDADRFAVAEKVNDSWFTFTGNQIGVLLASHIIDSIKHDSGKRIAVLNSAVSTGMLEKMALARGLHFEETLTGFKWMGNIARKLENDGFKVPFAFEEALGYMFTEVCYDKDGLTAALVFLAAEAKWRAQGLTPYTKLQQLFKEYGHHETMNSYFRSPNPDTTAALFRNIRNGSFVESRSLGSFRILRWRDMTEGYDSETPDKKPILPVDSSSQMLTLWLDRDIKFTLRGSGTEPKVKVYIESCQPSRDAAVAAVCETFSAVLKEWILPFAPTMTYSAQIPTSSGHIFKVPGKTNH
ncbi:hypothetical protein DTO164E3_1950 [Paecilomyces variotii]|nr:hypothetical protein DTO164E3_1950 [Paecilomyces variotii]